MNKYFLLQVKKVLKFINMFTKDNTTDTVIYTFLSVVTLLKQGEELQQLFIEKNKQTTSSSTSTKSLKNTGSRLKRVLRCSLEIRKGTATFGMFAVEGRVYRPCCGVRYMVVYEGNNLHLRRQHPHKLFGQLLKRIQRKIS